MGPAETGPYSRTLRYRLRGLPVFIMIPKSSVELRPRVREVRRVQAEITDCFVLRARRRRGARRATEQPAARVAARHAADLRRIRARRERLPHPGPPVPRRADQGAVVSLRHGV